MHSPFLFDDFKVTYKTFFQDFKESSEIVYVKRGEKYNYLDNIYSTRKVYQILLLYLQRSVS